MHTPIPGVTSDGGLCVKPQAIPNLSLLGARRALTSTVVAWLVIMALTLSCFAQTNPSPKTASGSDVIAVVLDRKVTANEKTRLRGIILGTLLTRYAEGNKIQPTDQEVDLYIERVGARNPAAQQGEQARAFQRQLAKDFVSAWKLNKALYEKYGGRVIYQQVGPEPLDAYRKFLEERESEGAFRIFDEPSKAEFWRYFTNDAMHVFCRPEEAAKLINTPWWMMKEDPKTQVATTAQVHRSSLEKAIRNNLRRLSAAADQFFLEKGVDKVTFDQLVGPGKYLEQLTPVDGEDYRKLDLTRGVTPWTIVSATGVTVTYNR